MANDSSSTVPPQPIQGMDPSNPVFTPPAAPPQPPQEASSLVPPMSVDTHMQSQQSGMKVVDPSRSCSYVAGFLKRVSGGEQAQHLEEAMVVVERMPTPLPDFHVDQGLTLLGELRRRLVQDIVPMTVEQLEQLRATCLGCVWRHREEWNRDVL